MASPTSFQTPPVFYCARAGKHLFYHAPHRQWQIYSKPSTRAIARLKTQRSPQMALGANWEVRQQTGTEATYVEASEALGENRREIVEMATPIPLIPDSSSHSSCSNLVHSSIGFHFCNSSFEEPTAGNNSILVLLIPLWDTPWLPIPWGINTRLSCPSVRIGRPTLHCSK